MKSVLKTVEIEWTIQKSRFIGFLTSVRTLNEMNAFVEECRQKHLGATHVCYAGILSTIEIAMKASDDGEPQKTAGVPMLEILKKNNLTDVVAVVVRYYGGIKLGASGLIRAYAKTIRCCVDKAILTNPQSFDECEIELDYSLSGSIEPYLRFVSILVEQTFTDKAVYRFVCPSGLTEQIFSEIKKRTSSDLKVKIIRSEIRFL